jgi:hypothetical protein
VEGASNNHIGEEIGYRRELLLLIFFIRFYRAKLGIAGKSRDDIIKTSGVRCRRKNILFLYGRGKTARE